MTQEALKLALEALGAYMSATDSEEDLKAHSLMAEAFFKIKEALAQEKALQALHNENERLGLYKDAYAEQEPVAKKKHEPKIDLGKYAGTYGGYTTPEPSEGYLQKAYRLANELRSHLSIAPAQRTFVGLTDEEIKAMDAGLTSNASFYAGALWAEAKLKEKNSA